ncbi:MAG: hypothetical protein FJ104_16945, partial [Deltaproteobacteria bacterium]|nr:hypothetical protein [Deltaproteobacteria bacterium]
NRADVQIELTNAGTGPLGFLVDCLPTPNDDDCPTEACFPEEARLEPLAPGASATLRFEVPYAEGIYRLRAAEGRDVPEGQFIAK